MPQWWLRPILVTVLRSTLLALAASSMALVTMPAAPVLAQGAATKPASLEEVNVYNTMGAVSACDLAVGQQVPLAKSLQSNSKMVAYILTTRHGSEIAGYGGSKIDVQRLFEGSYFEIVFRVRQGCYDKLTATDKELVDKVIAQLQKASPAPAPGDKK